MSRKLKYNFNTSSLEFDWRKTPQPHLLISAELGVEADLGGVKTLLRSFPVVSSHDCPLCKTELRKVLKVENITPLEHHLLEKSLLRHQNFSFSISKFENQTIVVVSSSRHHGGYCAPWIAALRPRGAWAALYEILAGDSSWPYIDPVQNTKRKLLLEQLKNVDYAKLASELAKSKLTKGDEPEFCISIVPDQIDGPFAESLVSVERSNFYDNDKTNKIYAEMKRVIEAAAKHLTPA